MSVTDYGACGMCGVILSQVGHREGCPVEMQAPDPAYVAGWKRGQEVLGGGLGAVVAATVERTRAELLLELVQEARADDEFVSGHDLEVRIGARVVEMIRRQEAGS